MGYVVKKDYFTDEISQDKSDGQEILAILGRISRLSGKMLGVGNQI